jgi:hypothetical protein
MSVHQKLGMILESKVDKKIESRKKCFYQKMISKIDILKWLTATYIHQKKTRKFSRKKVRRFEIRGNMSQTGYIVLLL